MAGRRPPGRTTPQLRSFEPPHGTPYVHLQEIEGPPRVHVDVECHDLDAAVWLARELGARLVAENERWRTLASPGGLPFCVLEASDHEPSQPVAWHDGHRSRMVKVCIDTPVAAHEREVAFWRAFLPGRWADSPAPGLAGKCHDDAGSRIQLLFQRLDEPDGPVRAHLDLGTDALAAEVDRLRDLGAGDGPDGAAALRDPAGPAVLRDHQLPCPDAVPGSRLNGCALLNQGGLMSGFDAHSGTRGGWQPRTGGPIGRWLTKQAIKQIRRKGKVPGLGFDALVVTTVGRKSGLVRTTPVGYFRTEQLADRGVGGWSPEESSVVPQRRCAPRQGRDRAHGQESRRGRGAAPRTGPRRGLASITTAVPRFEKYRQKTDRVLPIIRLVPRQE